MSQSLGWYEGQAGEMSRVFICIYTYMCIYIYIFFNKRNFLNIYINLFIYFIFGCLGSSLLRAGFL